LRLAECAIVALAQLPFPQRLDSEREINCLMPQCGIFGFELSEQFGGFAFG
jgi:hypothetical protein